MSLAPGKTFKDELDYMLQSARLPTNVKQVVGRMYRFGCEHGSHHRILVGTIIAIEASDEGGLELRVSNPKMWGRKIEAIAHTSKGWEVRTAKADHDRLMEGEWHEENEYPLHVFPGEFELLKTSLRDERKVSAAKALLSNGTIEGFELSVRTYWSLKNAGILKVSDLVRRSEEELLRSRNFGRKCLSEIKEILSENGLHLGMNDEEINKLGSKPSS